MSTKEQSEATQNKQQRTVYIVSESTGITAETLGKSLLSQFPHIEFSYFQRSFIDTVKKARALVDEINNENESAKHMPLVFATMPEDDMNKVLHTAKCHYYDIFDNFLSTIGKDLHAEPTRESGLSHGLNNEKNYDERIDALNFTLKHDDAMVLKTLGQADVIIIGVSRSGKTPTSLYLALKFGIKAANYPITDDDFAKNELPDILLDNMDKIFATEIDPKRLHQIREKRRPNSEYSSMQTCIVELKKTKQLYEKYDLKPMDVTTQSIEELAAQIVKKLSLNTSKDALI